MPRAKSRRSYNDRRGSLSENAGNGYFKRWCGFSELRSRQPGHPSTPDDDKDADRNVVDKITNQNDLPAIILSALKLPHSNFVWSRDVFNESVKEFAYYSNENALGWIAPQQNIVYSFNSKKVEELQPKAQTVLNDTVLMQAKAYLQTLYEQYLEY